MSDTNTIFSNNGLNSEENTVSVDKNTSKNQCLYFVNFFHTFLHTICSVVSSLCCIYTLCNLSKTVWTWVLICGLSSRHEKDDSSKTGCLFLTMTQQRAVPNCVRTAGSRIDDFLFLREGRGRRNWVMILPTLYLHLYGAVVNLWVFTFTSTSCSYLTSFSTHGRTPSPAAHLHGAFEVGVAVAT